MSRTERKLSIGSLTAAADLSSNLHYLVKVSAANQVNLAGAGETAVGVLLNKPESGEPAEVGVGVLLPVVAGEAIAAGADIAPDATGRARTAQTDDHICGIAVTAGGAAGREFTALMLPQTKSFSVGGVTADVGVAATKSITSGEMTALDADGYLVPADDATAVSFWGMALEDVDNSLGADGDESCQVTRDGITASGDLAAAGLAATDVGKECWVSTDSTTITTTPGDILVGTIEAVESATEPIVRYKPLPIVGQRTDRQFQIPFMHSGATLNGKNALSDMEFTRKYVVLGAYADAETAPGGTDDLTIELDDGATQYQLLIEDTATHGENKTPALTSPMLTTDTDVTLADTGTTTSDVKGVFFCEYL